MASLFRVDSKMLILKHVGAAHKTTLCPFQAHVTGRSCLLEFVATQLR